MNKQLGNGQMAEAREMYGEAAPQGHRASDCLGCRACERVCPQHIAISEFLQGDVKQVMEDENDML